MHVSRIIVQNYSRLADVDLEARGHLVMVGANDVGKTSLLRVLNLVLGPTAQLYQQLSTDDLRDKDEVLVAAITFENFDDDQAALFHREIDVDTTTRVSRLVVRLEVTVDPEDEDSVLISRWFPGRGEVRSPSREQLTAFGWRYLPALRQVSASHFDGAAGAVRALLRAVEADLGATESKLAELLDSFNTELAASRPLADLRGNIAEHLSSSMPRTVEPDDLAVRTAGDPSESVLGNVSMFMRRGSDFTPLSEQSDGMRQLMSMTLFDLAEGAANVIAIDEPEIHLHPASQRTVAELLTKNTNQKILVTHSPYIVQRFDPSQVVVVRADGTCKQIDTGQFTVPEKDQAHWWSPLMLEALTARYVIVVEGVADRLVVEAVARARGLNLDRIGAVVFELGGADNFPTVYRLLGPTGFGLEILGLVDHAERGRWHGAVGGKPKDVFGTTIFVSDSDLEDEYCRGLGADTVAERLLFDAVARDEKTLVQSAGVDDRASLEPGHLAKFCRDNKVSAAIAITRGLTAAEAATIRSVSGLLDRLEALDLL